MKRKKCLTLFSYVTLAFILHGGTLSLTFTYTHKTTSVWKQCSGKHQDLMR